MLTVSLHSISLTASIGLYPEEIILGNRFEIDVDISVVATTASALPFLDYTIIKEVVTNAFHHPEKLLEGCIQNIYSGLKEKFPEAEKIKIAVRKLYPPMSGEVKYAQVMFEG